MQFDISVDTEALVVDAYPQMKSAEHEGVRVDDMDIAWGFYMAMHTRHPEMMQAYASRMREMVKAPPTKFTASIKMGKMGEQRSSGI